MRHHWRGMISIAGLILGSACIFFTVGCESITHHDELERVKSSLVAETNENKRIKSELEDAKSAHPFEEALIGMAENIADVLVPQKAPLAIGEITLSGRRRVPDRVPDQDAHSWKAAPSMPISAEMDLLGPYIEDNLRVRVAATNKVVITKAAAIVLTGSYEPDTRDTIKLEVWLSRRDSDAILNAFVTRITRQGMNTHYLHFFNQIE